MEAIEKCDAMVYTKIFHGYKSSLWSGSTINCGYKSSLWPGSITNRGYKQPYGRGRSQTTAKNYLIAGVNHKPRLKTTIWPGSTKTAAITIPMAGVNHKPRL